MGSGLSAEVPNGKNISMRLDLELGVIECALQGAPHAGFGKRVERVHDQESAVGAQHRAAAQVHEIGGPHAARIVAALHGAEKIGIASAWSRRRPAKSLLRCAPATR